MSFRDGGTQLRWSLYPPVGYENRACPRQLLIFALLPNQGWSSLSLGCFVMTALILVGSRAWHFFYGGGHPRPIPVATEVPEHDSVPRGGKRAAFYDRLHGRGGPF